MRRQERERAEKDAEALRRGKQQREQVQQQRGHDPTPTHTSTASPAATSCVGGMPRQLGSESMWQRGSAYEERRPADQRPRKDGFSSGFSSEDWRGGRVDLPPKRSDREWEGEMDERPGLPPPGDELPTGWSTAIEPTTGKLYYVSPSPEHTCAFHQHLTCHKRARPRSPLHTKARTLTEY